MAFSGKYLDKHNFITQSEKLYTMFIEHTLLWKACKRALNLIGPAIILLTQRVALIWVNHLYANVMDD